MMFMGAFVAGMVERLESESEHERYLNLTMEYMVNRVNC